MPNSRLTQEEAQAKHRAEREEHKKALAGQKPEEMNSHDLMLHCGISREELTESRAQIDAVFENLPTAAKMAAGEQLKAVHEYLNAQSDLILGLHAVVFRLSATQH